ncbi:MAG: O-antigen translocase [Sodaliphilus sp.]
MASQNSISRMAMKAMGIFGGVQVIGILCSIVRGKLVAMWIGPVGVGLFGLFNQALEMLNTATNLGIRQSSVRDISQACENGENNASGISRMVTAVKRWSLWLGLAGVAITVALAPYLSQWTFGNDNHTWNFVVLSVALLFMALTNGEYAVLQGLSKLKRLAKASVFGTVFGFVLSVPMFYWMGESGVVPSIIAYAAGALLFAWILRDKEVKPAKLSSRETFTIGKGFVKLGIYMTLGVLVALVTSYVFNAWLNLIAGTAEVGYYQAGYTLVNKYTGLVLTALGMEYYPRLARVASSRLRLTAFVSQEVAVSMLLMAPILALFILLRSFVVWLLYAPEFEVIVMFVSWGMVGTVWRTLSWCMAFVILAKGDGKLFFITEVVSDLIGFALNIWMYQLWGITGLGIAFMVWYVVYTAMIYVVYRFHYGLQLSGTAIITTVLALVSASSVMCAMHYGLTVVAVCITVAVILLCGIMLKRQWSR